MIDFAANPVTEFPKSTVKFSNPRFVLRTTYVLLSKTLTVPGMSVARTGIPLTSLNVTLPAAAGLRLPAASAHAPAASVTLTSYVPLAKGARLSASELALRSCALFGTTVALFTPSLATRNELMLKPAPHVAFADALLTLAQLGKTRFAQGLEKVMRAGIGFRFVGEAPRSIVATGSIVSTVQVTLLNAVDPTGLVTVITNS